VVNADRLRVELIGAGVLVDEVVLQRCAGCLVRQRVIAQHVRGNGVDSVGRNDVAGEWLPDDSRSDGLSRQRVINNDSLRQQFGEVAGPHLGGGHRRRQRLGEPVGKPFERAEEERSVLHDRTTNRSARTLIRQLRLRLLRPFQEEVGLRKLVGPVIVVCRSSEGIRAALQRDVHIGAAGVPAGRVEARRLDLEFLYGAGRWHERHASAVGHVGRPVERKFISTRSAAGDNARRPAVVERTGELQVAVVGDSRCESCQ
jgi:hypothetical protein